MSKPSSQGLLVLLFVALLALLIVGPLWQLPGIPAGTPDEQLHAHRSAAVQRAFAQGVLWPRWFQTVYNGLGAPTFHHYSPALYWLVGAVHWAGISLDLSLKLVMSAALVLSIFGAYAWLRYVFSPVASLVAAAVLPLHPNTLTRMFYFGGDYPQMLALLLLPVCLWALTALHMHARAKYWLASVGAMTALVLSHNLTAMAGAAVLGLYWLLLAIGYRRADGLLRCALAALTAALLSAAFWLPALADLTLVQIENARQEFYHFSNHFLSLTDLFSAQSLLLDSRAGAPLRPPVTFGVATWVALAAGVAGSLFAARREVRFWGLGGVVFGLASVSLTLSASEPVWETVPGLSFLQFPPRLLSIAAIGALPATALAVDAWPSRRRWLPGVALLTVCILVISPYLFPAHTHFSSSVAIKASSDDDIREIERVGGAWGLTGSDEFLVTGADKDVIVGNSPEPDAVTLTWLSPHVAVADLAGQNEPVLLRLHYHPGWSAGESATLSQGEAGWMQATELVDPDQPLTVEWSGTTWQRWGERLSLTGLSTLVVAFLLLRSRRRFFAGDVAPPVAGMPHENGMPHKNLVQSPFHNVVALVCCVALLTTVRFAINASGGGPFLLHSAPGQLAFPVLGKPVELGNPDNPLVTFLGWEILQGSNPKPGGQIVVRIYWQPLGELHDKLNGFIHLYTPTLQQSWAADNRGAARPDSQYWRPDKYYVDELRLALPTDLPPITYSLIAGMVESSGERLAVPGNEEENILYLRELTVAPTRPGFSQVMRPAISARAETGDSLRLQGFDLLQAADSHTLRLFWETGSSAPDSDWITYIHMLDSQGELVAQYDGPALAGLLPTGQWLRNAMYIDRRQLDLPAGLPAGSYQLRVGLYDFSSGQRLPFQPGADAHLHFQDGQLHIPLNVGNESGSSE